MSCVYDHLPKNDIVAYSDIKSNTIRIRPSKKKQKKNKYRINHITCEDKENRHSINHIVNDLAIPP